MVTQLEKRISDYQLCDWSVMRIIEKQKLRLADPHSALQSHQQYYLAPVETGLFVPEEQSAMSIFF